LTEDGTFKRLLPEDAEHLFPKRTLAKIDDLPEEMRETARLDLKRRFSEAKQAAAFGRLSGRVRLVSLAPPEAAPPEPASSGTNAA
jgi:hypothetical protein